MVNIFCIRILQNIFFYNPKISKIEIYWFDRDGILVTGFHRKDIKLKLLFYQTAAKTYAFLLRMGRQSDSLISLPLQSKKA